MLILVNVLEAVSYQLCHRELSHPLPLPKEGIKGDLVGKDQLIQNTMSFMKKIKVFFLEKD